MSKFHFHDVPSVWEESLDYVPEWLTVSLKEEGLRVRRVAYRFVSDEVMRTENKRLLDHDYYTDIITFGEVVNDRVLADIIVSYDRIFDNAKQLDKSVLDERDRVLIHGLLHLCGYNDSTDSEKLIMRKLEDKYLLLRP
ncbi:rRNA maturation RNase YbeY [Phaeocystidibacter luteus]|uniref:Endoribonuclease YbeY n=1 Tax=Phaeocystidibacter luteus TaxID=911197 RepID=A0A6N6RL15_9FLAO|nr:rRNA maturation RNase YbeY [Phaeocystidibacter luteus]KAB2810137.1 rRNA maturation RNase YbeY [Phaeocystidibacter luteus]